MQGKLHLLLPLLADLRSLALFNTSYGNNHEKHAVECADCSAKPNLLTTDGGVDVNSQTIALAKR